MKFIYHGSKRKLEVLEPNQAFGFGGEADCQNGVYGVVNPSLAIPFALKIAAVSSNSVFKVDTEVNPPKITLVNCELDWSHRGYLYKLPIESFEKLDQYQWVSRVPVIPVEVTEINPEDYRGWVVEETT